MRVWKRLDTGVLVDALTPENAVAAVVGDIVAIYSPRDETLPLVCPDVFCARHSTPPAGADYLVGAPEGWYWAADAWNVTDKAFRLRPLSEPIPSVRGEALYRRPACCEADPPRPPMADGTVPPPSARRAPARPPATAARPLPPFIPPAFRR